MNMSDFVPHEPSPHDAETLAELDRSPYPTAARFVAVLSGTSTWTPEEQAAIDGEPSLQDYARRMREALVSDFVAGILSETESGQLDAAASADDELAAQIAVLACDARYPNVNRDPAVRAQPDRAKVESHATGVSRLSNPSDATPGFGFLAAGLLTGILGLLGLVGLISWTSAHDWLPGGASDGLAVAFMACLTLVAYTYLGYPLVVWLFSRAYDQPAVRAPDDELPTVSLLIAAYNEEQNIEARIHNALALDYPAGKLEVVIASDGSTDGTNDIVRRYADRGVRLLAYAGQRGKATVLDESVPRLRGQVVLLSNANTHMESDAARRLAAWFTDAEVGVVCGRLVLTDPRTGRSVDGMYWEYEAFINRCENRLGALAGSNSAIYAIRRDLFPVVRPGTILDNLVIPLEAKRRSGCRIVYDAAAIAHEETVPTIMAEFRRRVRVGAGGFQSIGMLWPLLSPAYGWVAFTFLCHKVLRWACPFFLLGALAANILLLGHPVYDALMAAQVGLYVLAVAGNWLPARPRWLRCLRLPAMFVFVNAALFIGFQRWAFGRQRGAWMRQERTPNPDRRRYPAWALAQAVDQTVGSAIRIAARG
jgi:cellulose synthase/poly-beta-1,6-N-acetylglucosamine synthase-like glycosyltransferase